ncbi:MAG TPA: DUF1992 domain-containing protein [Tepidisphaeraceae bacterium]|jgi:hypothetical protein
MNLRNLDVDAVLRRLAEKRIEDAMEEGKFDNLPGKGEPIEIDEAPTDEKARMTWWALRIMRQNDFVPDEVRWRKSVDKMKADLHQATDERVVVKLCEQINATVHKLNTMGTNAINLAMTGVNVDAELARVRAKSS